MLPEGGALELLLGSAGAREGLSARLVVDEGDEEGEAELVAELPLPETRFDLRPVRWRVPSEWAGARVRLHLVDASEETAIFADDLWLWGRAP